MDAAGVSYSESSSKDRDYLLDYKSKDLGNLGREEVLGVPLDNVTQDEAVALILDLVEKKTGPHHVLFLDPIKLTQLRPGKKLGYLTESSRLLLPDGAGLQWAAAKLGRPLRERIPMISLIMDVIRLAEKTELTIYLLGSRTQYLEYVFFNLQRSFPGVRIIGRQGGYFDADREHLVKESLRKSSPDIIFIGMGFPDQEIWLNKNREYLSQAVIIGVDGSFDILSGKERKAPDWFQLRGLTWLWRTIVRPWNLKRVFLMIQFFVSVSWRAFRQKGSN